MNTKATGLQWKSRKPKNYRYVDDRITITKINMISGAESVTNGKKVMDKHDLQTVSADRQEGHRQGDGG